MLPANNSRTCQLQRMPSPKQHGSHIQHASWEISRGGCRNSIRHNPLLISSNGRPYSSIRAIPHGLKASSMGLTPPQDKLQHGFLLLSLLDHITVHSSLCTSSRAQGPGRASKGNRPGRRSRLPAAISQCKASSSHRCSSLSQQEPYHPNSLSSMA